ncbi:MAG: hypothetical protein QOI77_2523, partial [Blastocatellia bacterium]|nr:hypothetical protein [Blastocatellia bacterium]
MEELSQTRSLITGPNAGEPGHC